MHLQEILRQHTGGTFPRITALIPSVNMDEVIVRFGSSHEMMWALRASSSNGGGSPILDAKALPAVGARPVDPLLLENLPPPPIPIKMDSKECEGSEESDESPRIAAVRPPGPSPLRFSMSVLDVVT